MKPQSEYSIQDLRKRISHLEAENARLTNLLDCQQNLLERASHLSIFRQSWDARDAFQGELIYVSPSFVDIMGVKERSRFDSWFDSIHPSDAGRVREAYRQAATKGQIFNEVMRIRHPDDRDGDASRWVRMVAYPVFAENGKPTYFDGFIIDVTDLKSAETAAQASETNYRLLFDTQPDAVFIADIDNQRIVDVNPAAVELYGYTVEEMCGLDPIALSAEPEKSAEHIRKVMADLTRGKKPDLDRRLHRRKDGTVFPVEIATGAFHLKGKLMICVMVRDISQRVRMEEALREIHAQQRAILNNIPDLAWLKDADSRFIAVNEAFGNACGKDPAWLIGKTDLDAWPAALANRYREDDRKVIRSGRRVRVDEPLHSNDGRKLWIETIKTPVLGEAGEIIGTTGIARDVTERRAWREQLERERRRLLVTLHSIGDAVITTDRDGRIVLMNPIAEKLTGWTEADAVGLPMTEVFRIEDERTGEPCPNPVEKILASGQTIGLANHTVLVAKDGQRYVIADSGAPIMDLDDEVSGVVLVFRDITAQERTHKEMLKMEKLKSLGVLAGGIAHDFNNFLTGIIGSLSLAKLDVTPGNPIRRSLDEMEKAAMRAKELTQQLLTFSKGGEPVKHTTDIAKLIREAVNFVLHGSNVNCRFDIEKDLKVADVDESQIAQVIQNLIINADQAMPRGGTVVIRCENVVLPPDNPLDLGPGNYVQVAVQDDGMGIHPDHLKKVFDPYFTTKQKGSGLGLAVAFNIVAKHGGHLTAESALGGGTTFTILLPASVGEQTIDSEKEPQLVTGHGRILVMDDENYIRDLASTMLTKMGYDVVLAPNGRVAVDLYQEAMEAQCPFDAVILDLTVPGGMGGKETIEQLIHLDPKVRAIVSSGYSNDPVMANHTQYGFRGAVKKPYLVQEMSKVLAEIINS